MGRLRGTPGYPGLPWTARNAVTNVVLHTKRLDEPLRWHKQRTVFVCSMADLFHEQVPDEFLDRVFAAMALAPRHTFQVLTKRPERMRGYLAAARPRIAEAIRVMGGCTFGASVMFYVADLADSVLGLAGTAHGDEWPLPNVWLGTSAEDQERANERIPLLIGTPAAVHFVSLEPLLGPIVLPDGWIPKGLRGGPRLDWALIGGESGPQARLMDIAWARSLVAQCRAAGVTPFCKQLGSVWARQNGSTDSHGGNIAEWPDDLQVREWPA